MNSYSKHIFVIDTQKEKQDIKSAQKPPLYLLLVATPPTQG